MRLLYGGKITSFKKKKKERRDKRKKQQKLFLVFPSVFDIVEEISRK